MTNLEKRISIAKEEVKKKPCDINKIIEHINKYLDVELNVNGKEVKDKIITLGGKQQEIKKHAIYLKDIDLDKEKIDYNEIKKVFNLEEEISAANYTYIPIVWLKFTTDDYLGVVASSNDFNFSPNLNSGKIIESVNKKWNTSKLVIIPLTPIMLKNAECKNSKNCVKRNLIEKEIGEYLIKQGIPMLDKRSHLY